MLVAEVKLTKTELRAHQVKLDRLKKYLPTLQLKKAMLQVEVIQAGAEIEMLKEEFLIAEEKVSKFSSLLSPDGQKDFRHFFRNENRSRGNSA